MEDEMVIKIMARSSSDKDAVYSVEFKYENEKLTVFCTCEAGIHRQFCKHKYGLLCGDEGMLKDAAEKEKLLAVQDLVAKTKYCEMLKELGEFEKMLQQAKVKRDKAKKRLEEAMRYGM